MTKLSNGLLSASHGPHIELAILTDDAHAAVVEVHAPRVARDARARGRRPVVARLYARKGITFRPLTGHIRVGKRRILVSRVYQSLQFFLGR